MKKKTKKIIAIVVGIIILAIVLEFTFVLILRSGWDCPSADSNEPIMLDCILDTNVVSRYLNKTITIKGFYHVDDSLNAVPPSPIPQIGGKERGFSPHINYLSFTTTEGVNTSTLIEGKEYYFTGFLSGSVVTCFFHVSDIEPAPS